MGCHEGTRNKRLTLIRSTPKGTVASHKVIKLNRFYRAAVHSCPDQKGSVSGTGPTPKPNSLGSRTVSKTPPLLPGSDVNLHCLRRALRQEVWLEVIPPMPGRRKPVKRPRCSLQRASSSGPVQLKWVDSSGPDAIFRIKTSQSERSLGLSLHFRSSAPGVTSKSHRHVALLSPDRLESDSGGDKYCPGNCAHIRSSSTPEAARKRLPWVFLRYSFIRVHAQLYCKVLLTNR